MWNCPKCGAINFDIGPCQCCGYGSPTVYSASDTLPLKFVEELEKNP